MAAPRATRVISAIFGDVKVGRLFVQHSYVWRKCAPDRAYMVADRSGEAAPPVVWAGEEVNLRAQFASWESVRVIARA